MKWIIADSGGTNTSWAYSGKEVLGRFETASLHPRNQSDFPEADRLKIQELIQKNPNVPLHFFGAGMSHSENRQNTKTLLSEIGFQNITIETDALAAGIALCGKNHGYAAILGTGSIVLEMDHGKIVQRIGGLGPALGDEGSGFYFGKLLIEWAKEEENWSSDLIELFGSKEKLLQELETNEGIRYCSELAKRASAMNFDTIHRENFVQFAKTHLDSLATGVKILHVSGSYGFYNKEVLKEVLASFGWSLGRCLAGPMEELIDFFRKNND